LRKKTKKSKERKDNKKKRKRQARRKRKIMKNIAKAVELVGEVRYFLAARALRSPRMELGVGSCVRPVRG